MAERTIDARGKSCPLPIVELARLVKQSYSGDVIVVLADDKAFPADIQAWCKKTRHELLSLGNDPGCYRATVRKAAS